MSYRDRDGGITRVFVGNLPDGCRESEVERLFSKASSAHSQ